MSAERWNQEKARIAAELRADAIAGRGRLPRDAGGRIPPGYLEAVRSAPRSSSDPEPLAQTLARLSAWQANQAASSSSGPAGRVERLEWLERELEQLLASSAPAVWAQIRRPLWKLLRQARRELRAADAAAPALE